jgi:type VI secretion system protein ImpA
VPLVSSRQHGTFSLRDIEIAAGHLPPGEGDARPDEAQIGAAFGAMPLAELTALQQSVEGGVAAVKQIGAKMLSEGGIEVVPELLDALGGQLGRVDRVLKTHLAARTGVEPGESSGEGEGEGGQQPGAAVVTVGSIKSRQDAVRALDAVAEYFRRNEPSSPIPLFVERAKRLVSKSFLEVLADVVPDAVGQARTAGGVPEDQ